MAFLEVVEFSKQNQHRRLDLRHRFAPAVVHAVGRAHHAARYPVGARAFHFHQLAPHDVADRRIVDLIVAVNVGEPAFLLEPLARLQNRRRTRFGKRRRRIVGVEERRGRQVNDLVDHLGMFDCKTADARRTRRPAHHAHFLHAAQLRNVFDRGLDFIPLGLAGNELERIARRAWRLQHVRNQDLLLFRIDVAGIVHVRLGRVAVSRMRQREYVEARLCEVLHPGEILVGEVVGDGGGREAAVHEDDDLGRLALGDVALDAGQHTLAQMQADGLVFVGRYRRDMRCKAVDRKYFVGCLCGGGQRHRCKQS